MNILNEIKNINKEIEAVKQNVSINKISSLQDSSYTGSLFSAMEIRRKSDNSLIQVEKSNESNLSFMPKNVNRKEKRKIFRITYLRTAVPFLDLKSIMNIGLLNKEFYYFIFSIYFYKIINNVKLHNIEKKLKEDNLKTPKKSKFTSVGNTPVDNQYSASKMVGSLFGAITGAFNVLGIFNFYLNK